MSNRDHKNIFTFDVDIGKVNKDKILNRPGNSVISESIKPSRITIDMDMTRPLGSF